MKLINKFCEIIQSVVKTHQIYFFKKIQDSIRRLNLVKILERNQNLKLKNTFNVLYKNQFQKSEQKNVILKHLCNCFKYKKTNVFKILKRNFAQYKNYSNAFNKINQLIQKQETILLKNFLRILKNQFLTFELLEWFLQRKINQRLKQGLRWIQSTQNLGSKNHLIALIQSIVNSRRSIFMKLLKDYQSSTNYSLQDFKNLKIKSEQITKKKINLLKKQKDYQIQKIENMEKQKGYQQQLQEFNIQKNNVNIEVIGIENEVKNNNIIIQENQQKVKKLDNEYHNLEENFEKVQKQIIDNETDIKKKHELLTHQETLKNQQSKFREETIEQLKNEINKVELDINEIQNMIIEQSQIYNIKKDEIDNQIYIVDKDFNDLKKQLEQCNVQKQNNKIDKEKLNKMIEQDNNDLNKIQNQIQKIKFQTTEIIQEKNNLQKQIEENRQKNLSQKLFQQKYMLQLQFIQKEYNLENQKLDEFSQKNKIIQEKKLNLERELMFQGDNVKISKRNPDQQRFQIAQKLYQDMVYQIDQLNRELQINEEELKYQEERVKQKFEQLEYFKKQKFDQINNIEESQNRVNKLLAQIQKNENYKIQLHQKKAYILKSLKQKNSNMNDIKKDQQLLKIELDKFKYKQKKVIEKKKNLQYFLNETGEQNNIHKKLLNRYQETLTNLQNDKNSLESKLNELELIQHSQEQEYDPQFKRKLQEEIKISVQQQQQLQKQYIQMNVERERIKVEKEQLKEVIENLTKQNQNLKQKQIMEITKISNQENTLFNLQENLKTLKRNLYYNHIELGINQKELESVIMREKTIHLQKTKIKTALGLQINQGIRLDQLGYIVYNILIGIINRQLRKSLSKIKNQRIHHYPQKDFKKPFNKLKILFTNNSLQNMKYFLIECGLQKYKIILNSLFLWRIANQQVNQFQEDQLTNKFLIGIGTLNEIINKSILLIYNKSLNIIKNYKDENILEKHRKDFFNKMNDLIQFIEFRIKNHQKNCFKKLLNFENSQNNNSNSPIQIDIPSQKNKNDLCKTSLKLGESKEKYFLLKIIHIVNFKRRCLLNYCFKMLNICVRIEREQKIEERDDILLAQILGASKELINLRCSLKQRQIRQMEIQERINKVNTLVISKGCKKLQNIFLKRVLRLI